MLSVITPVEKRAVPALSFQSGDPSSELNIEVASALSPVATWEALDRAPATNLSKWYFDLSDPLPTQRFYRARQSNSPGPPLVLDVRMVPVITLTNPIGSHLRLDYINVFGPVDAWVALANVTMTSTSQQYFDVSAVGQPPRLYRIIPIP